MEENFTLTTSKVEGFQSTWEDPDAEKPTQSMGTETDTIKTVETGVNCDEAVLDVGVGVYHFAQIKLFLLNI